jgi:NAD(P)-dependent dehydrogenase (short-subunit alcohol dehydrogenase family)
MTSILDRFRLDGKVVVITGASSGLGRGFAHALSDAGATLALGPPHSLRGPLHTIRLGRTTGRMSSITTAVAAGRKRVRGMISHELLESLR